MRLLKRATAIAVFLSFACFAAVSPRAAGTDDTDAGKQQITALIEEALHSFTHGMTRDQNVAEMHKLIAKFGDVPTSAHDVLGRYWAKATPEQQAEFQGLLVDYAIESWVDQIGDMPTDEHIEFLAAAASEDGRMQIRSLAETGATRLPVDWTLARVSDGHMAIVDVAVSGVSIIKAMGADFTAIVRSNGGRIEPLLDAMRQKIATLRQSH